ncbi:hypothetical protein ACOME3_004834 [Neoechinorhynchus agilis]
MHASIDKKRRLRKFEREVRSEERAPISRQGLNLDGSRSTETDEEEESSSRNEGDSVKEEKPVPEKEASETVDDRAKKEKLSLKRNQRSYCGEAQE